MAQPSRQSSARPYPPSRGCGWSDRGTFWPSAGRCPCFSRPRSWAPPWLRANAVHGREKGLCSSAQQQLVLGALLLLRGPAAKRLPRCPPASLGLARPAAEQLLPSRGRREQPAGPRPGRAVWGGRGAPWGEGSWRCDAAEPHCEPSACHRGAAGPPSTPGARAPARGAAPGARESCPHPLPTAQAGHGAGRAPGQPQAGGSPHTPGG